MRIFYFSYNYGTVQITYAIQFSKSVYYKVLIVSHVVGIDFYLKIIVSGGVVAFCYSFGLLYGLHELPDQIARVVLLQSYVA